VKVRLESADRGLVHEDEMLDFNKVPEIAAWGTRLFVLDPEIDPGLGGQAVYVEAMAWPIGIERAGATGGGSVSQGRFAHVNPDGELCNCPPRCQPAEDA